MHRFPHFPTRKVQDLGGTWDFAFLGDVDADRWDAGGIDWTDRMVVPAAFDATPRYAGLRGLAAYRTLVKTPPGKRMRLNFAAVSMWSRVIVDRRVCGPDHGCGYAPFHRDFTAGESGKSEVVVLVDNRFDPERSPLHEIYYDFYQWGGILRDVTLHELADVVLESVCVRTVDPAGGRVRILISADGVADGSHPVGIGFDDNPPECSSVDFRDGRAELSACVPHPRVWSTDTPSLHRLGVALGGDQMDVRFGLRTVGVRGREILLNGEPVRLFGFNRHEAHGQTGPVLGADMQLHDIHHLKEMGCNFVRGSHYPQDQRFLDMCDEAGLLVWEEALGWGQKESHLTSEAYRTAHDECLREMIRESWNHPSVIVWGFLNEAETDAPEALPFLEHAASVVRELDPTRLVSYASNRPFTDRCFSVADIVSLNLYPGWYGCEDIEDPLGLVVPGLREPMEAIQNGPAAGKPVLLSEIGIEALPGWQDAFSGFYTEDFQARYLEVVLREVLADPRWAGVAIWHFADVRTYRGGRAIRRPRAYNNKGVLDEYRRPKKAVSVVGEMLRSQQPHRAP